MPNFSIGVDLGATNLRIAAVNQSGDLLEKISLGTQAAMGRDHVLHEMCNAIRALVSNHQSPSSLLDGIGIGIPGILDMRTGLLRESPNLPGWADSPMQAQIEHILGARVIVENDANVAALGEKWLGAARGVDDMIMLTLGSGLGGGIVLGGRIWHGMAGMAGEIGHMTVESEGLPCSCGNRGCIEQYVSASAIVRMAEEAISAGRSAGLAKAATSDPDFDAKAVYTLAMHGDQEAMKIFSRLGRALGICIANLINIFNLPMYVVGGGISSAWEAFSPSTFQELKERSMVYSATAPVPQVSNARSSSRGVEPEGLCKTIVTRALLGSDAGLFGAARLPMIHSLKSSSL